MYFFGGDTAHLIACIGAPGLSRPGEMGLVQNVVAMHILAGSLDTNSVAAVHDERSDVPKVNPEVVLGTAGRSPRVELAVQTDALRSTACHAQVDISSGRSLEYRPESHPEIHLLLATLGPDGLRGTKHKKGIVRPPALLTVVSGAHEAFPSSRSLRPSQLLSRPENAGGSRLAWSSVGSDLPPEAQ
jgi:hypothetical protein